MSNPTRDGDTAATGRLQHRALNVLLNTPRRLFLRAAGVSALALHSIGASAAARRSTVEVTEGPYFVDA